MADDLRREIGRGQVVFVVGAGVSLASTNGRPVASWAGLLKDGIERCVIIGRATGEWRERMLDTLNEGSTIAFLNVADDVAERLGGYGNGEYRLWLKDTVGSLIPEQRRIIEALYALRLPLVTTNYDELLEDVTGLKAITWKQHSEVESFLRGELQAVLHLHGVWRDPESVVLCRSDYERRLADEHAQDAMKSLRMVRTLVFLGFGGGMSDPTFEWFLEWSARVFSGSTYRGYRLTLKQDGLEIQETHQIADRIMVVPYGETHHDLAPFLESLRPENTNAAQVEIAVSQSLIWNAPYPRSMEFVGRTELLEELNKRLLHIDNPNRWCYLSGIGGVGKSQLALEFAYSSLSKIDRVYWIGCETESQFLADMAKLAQHLNLDVNLEKQFNASILAILGAIDAPSSPYLVVLDNAVDNVRIALFSALRHGAVLVTTRDLRLSKPLNRVDVGIFGSEDSLELLRRRTGRVPNLAAEKLIDRLGNLPLAIAQAAAFIYSRDIDYGEYLVRLNDRPLDLLEYPGLEDYAGPVATTWDISFQEVIKNNPLAEGFVKILAFLNPSSINLNLFSLATSVLPVPLLSLATNPQSLDEVIIELRRFGLVSTLQDNHIAMHRLVHEVIRSRLIATNEFGWGRLALGLVGLQLPVGDKDRPLIERIADLLPQLEFVVDIVGGLGLNDRLLWEMEVELGVIYTEGGRYQEAFAILQDAVPRLEKYFKPLSPELATAFHHLARSAQFLAHHDVATQYLRSAISVDTIIYGAESIEVAKDQQLLSSVLRATNEYPEARQLIEKALSTAEHHRDSHLSFLGVCLNDLGLTLRQQGYPGLAKKKHEEALEIHRQHHGERHYEVGTDLGNLGEDMLALSELSDAQIVFEQALEIHTAWYGPDHPIVAHDVSNLARCFREMGELGKAQTLYDSIIKIVEATFGADHPVVSAWQGNVAQIAFRLGDLESSERLIRSALAARLGHHSPDHHAISVLYGNLALVLHKREQSAAALDLINDAIDSLTSILGDQHRDLSVLLNNRAAILGDKGSYIEAERDFKAAIAIRDANHDWQSADAAMLLNNYATFLSGQGNREEAWRLFERGLSLQIAMLGNDHHDVGVTLHNVGIFHAERGNFHLAILSLDRSLTVFQRIFGLTHPTSRNTLENLLAVLSNRGMELTAQSSFYESRQTLVKGLSLSRKSGNSSYERKFLHLIRELEVRVRSLKNRD